MTRTKEEIECDLILWKANRVMVKQFRRELADLDRKPKKVKKIVKPKVYTKDELMGLNKVSQVELLEGLGVEGNGIPATEKKRVAMIFKLQINKI